MMMASCTRRLRLFANQTTRRRFTTSVYHPCFAGLAFMLAGTKKWALLRSNARPITVTGFSMPKLATTRTSLSLSADASKYTDNDKIILPPWNDPGLLDWLSAKKQKNNSRFRQHVNPLARQYQLPTVLNDQWPRSAFVDMSKPLFLDIGCGKGGFILDYCAQQEHYNLYNLLGLEIRPGVAQYAQQRIATHGRRGQVDIVGCNANVDLDRILSRYHRACHETANNDRNRLERVAIQFPDPHFKTQHAKRRVVTPRLVHTLARYMPPNATAQVLLQSDVPMVLDEMRARFRDCDDYFVDARSSTSDYVTDNPFGVPTEREVRVLQQGLPVYRALFTRNDVDFREETLST